MSQRAELVEAVRPTLVTTPEDPAARTVTQSGLTVFDVLEKQGPQFAKAMQSQAGADRLVRIITTEVRRNPKLGQCTVPSMLGAAMLCAQLSLEPGPMAHAYLIPRRNRSLETRGGPEVHEVNWQLGYRGMLAMANRSGSIRSIYADKVCENDRFVERRGSSGEFIHEIDRRNPRGEVFAYYCYAELADGGYLPPMVLTMDEIWEFRDRSDAWRSAETKVNGKPWTGKKDSPWHTDEHAMCLKTVVRRQWPWLPLTDPAASEAYTSDGAVVDADVTVNPDEITVNSDDLALTMEADLLEADSQATSPELESGEREQVTIHPVPDDDTDATEPGPDGDTVSADSLIDLAKDAGLIPKRAGLGAARKALLPIGVDAGAGEYGDADTLATEAGDQVAAWLQTKIDEGGGQ